jgi:hypothetical protein
MLTGSRNDGHSAKTDIIGLQPAVAHGSAPQYVNVVSAPWGATSLGPHTAWPSVGAASHATMAHAMCASVAQHVMRASVAEVICIQVCNTFTRPLFMVCADQCTCQWRAAARKPGGQGSRWQRPATLFSASTACRHASACATASAHSLQPQPAYASRRGRGGGCSVFPLLCERDACGV